ncbi:MAG: hypothetical protein A3G51_01715 [Candidatus Yanofskybacteria bacterium RIFCSPLOWO2_12_FULL_43_11b]|uniref:Uncharacterized protein n=1 Tax=Candidatus Yanofskybacteria bacterium RIFCSPLOWO2_12_FULL_43_11b TaxID=1802710 RepID=A0A1F8H934_9BACT|nr:MAG: hypothetical protein A3G51_01715 [Candidatus Yanofskybacteria bacterium RIFCSPLOWO2_12_FULL_43_11b]
MQEWALCLPGTFPRLGPHAGALHAFHDAASQGLLEKEPSFISTSSVSFIPASIYVQGSEREHVEFEEKLINLRKRHFVSLHPDLKKRAFVDFLSIAGLLIAAHETGKIKNRLISRMALLALGFPAYKIAEKTVKDIFSVESFLVYDNLRELLLQTLKFDLIFKSSIKIEVPAVNLNTAGWTLDQILSNPPLYLNGWRNRGWVSVTNFRPEDINLEEEVRNARYVEGGINGLRVFGHFGPGKHDGKGQIVDTAALSNLPIHFAVKEGYSNIVVLHYNSRAEGPLDRSFANWVGLLSRCFDITISENTRKTILGHLRVNNDLEQLAKQREDLKRIEELLHAQKLDAETQQAISRHIQNIRQTMQNLSYSQKKIIKFIFVGSDPIPDAHFNDFTKDQMLEGINKGWKAGWDTVPKINKMIA